MAKKNDLRPRGGQKVHWRQLLKKYFKVWWPLALVLIAITWSFFYGWYHDGSKPQSGRGWGDQGLYLGSSNHLASGQLPDKKELHYAVGYPILGLFGRLIASTDPFMAVSFALLVASVAFSFLAVKHLFGNFWAVAFSALLFYWDGVARSFNFASELFAVPWSNQVLFFAFAFYFWLFVTRLKKPPSFRFVTVVGFVSGLAFVTREEAILFAAPVMVVFLFFSKADWRKWALGFVVMSFVFLPQLAIKQAALGSPASSRNDASYNTILTERYFRIDYLYRNIREVIIDSDSYDKTATDRNALFQEAWWLWLAPIGLLVLLFGRSPPGIKFFVLVSLGLMLFYLSGPAMSAQKLTFHCLRYISPGFIALNLGVVVVLRAVWQLIKRSVKQLKEKKDQIAKSVMRAIHDLPFMIPIFLSLAGLFAIIILLLGSLHNFVVWPGLTALLVFSFWVVHKHADRLDLPGGRRERALVGLIVLLFVGAWGLVNMRYTAQHVYVNRDPGIYTVTAVELLDSSDLKLDQKQIFEKADGVTDASFGFGNDVDNDESLYAQGAHLLPVLFGLAGRVVGESAMLHLGPVIGVASLLVFYGFARILVKPRWALLATIAMSLSLPFIYFSRDTYTEPLTMLFVFGGLSTLWLAQKKQSRPLWFISGLVLAASTLVRIDAYITIAAVLVYASVYIALQKKGQLKAASMNVLLLVAGMTVSGLVGWLGLTMLSSGYYRDLRDKFVLEMFLTVVTALVLLGMFVVTKRWNVIQRLDGSTKTWRRPALAGLVALICIFLVSRPLWFVGHQTNTNALVAGMQQASGAVVDGTRTYAEITFNWNAWYLGPVLAVLGMTGFVVAAYCMSRSKKQTVLLAPAFVVIFITMAVYFMKPSISADQIWAARRMLPVIMPGLALFGVYALSKIVERWKLSKDKTYVLCGALVLSIFIPVLSVSSPFLRTREDTPLLSQIHSICSALPKNAVVVWYGRMGDIATQTTEAFCNKPSVKLTNAGTDNLKAVHKEAVMKGYKPIIGMSEGDSQELLSAQNMDVVSSVSYERLEQTLEEPPQLVNTRVSTVFLGKIQSDGTIEGLSED